MIREAAVGLPARPGQRAAPDCATADRIFAITNDWQVPVRSAYFVRDADGPDLINPGPWDAVL